MFAEGRVYACTIMDLCILQMDGFLEDLSIVGCSIGRLNHGVGLGLDHSAHCYIKAQVIFLFHSTFEYIITPIHGMSMNEKKSFSNNLGLTMY